MEPTTNPATCFRCERPALTFDSKKRPLCGRHATFFVSAVRQKSQSGTGQELRSEEASVADDPGTEERAVPGSHLWLVVDRDEDE